MQTQTKSAVLFQAWVMWRGEAPRSSCILMYKESFSFYHFVKLKFELIPYNGIFRQFEKQLDNPKFKSVLLDYYQLQYAIQVAHPHDTVIVLTDADSTISMLELHPPSFFRSCLHWQYHLKKAKDFSI